MTRINSNIKVRELTDEHLLAEHREIKRLPSCLKKSIQCNSIKNIPNEFTLSAGHVKFFLDKQKFIYDRYKEIHEELLRRKFNIEDYSDNWKDIINSEYFNNYVPTIEERNLLKERIINRIHESTKKSWHYYKQIITKTEAINLLD